VQLNKPQWAAVALTVAAGAYAAYTAVALYRSFARLEVGFAAAGAATRASQPTPASLSSGAGGAANRKADSGRERPAHPADAPGRVRPPVPRIAAVAADDSTLAAPEEDPNLLRQRALLDAQANPDLAELFNDPNPEVRKAALDLFQQN